MKQATRKNFLRNFLAAAAVMLLAGSAVAAEEVLVFSREDGSGTRGAFTELFKLEEKDASGKKVDITTDEASITNSTAVMITSVSQTKNAIGYISLGSLNDSVKALKIDGAEASVKNIKDGSYKISRPFNIAVKEGVSELAKDFINFILSSEGQAIVEKNGYISSVTAPKAYAGAKPAGKLTVGGSSSVTPVMEKLKEAYLKLNTNANIEIQLSDSTTGMNSAIEGVCEIGMASRELKDSELKKGLTPIVIALDGIAVIVNKANPVSELSSAQVTEIYSGKLTEWPQK